MTMMITIDVVSLQLSLLWTMLYIIIIIIIIIVVVSE